MKQSLIFFYNNCETEKEAKEIEKELIRERDSMFNLKELDYSKTQFNEFRKNLRELRKKDL